MLYLIYKKFKAKTEIHTTNALMKLDRGNLIRDDVRSNWQTKHNGIVSSMQMLVAYYFRNICCCDKQNIHIRFNLFDLKINIILLYISSSSSAKSHGSCSIAKLVQGVRIKMARCTAAMCKLVGIERSTSSAAWVK